MSSCIWYFSLIVVICLMRLVMLNWFANSNISWFGTTQYQVIFNMFGKIVNLLFFVAWSMILSMQMHYDFVEFYFVLNIYIVRFPYRHQSSANIIYVDPSVVLFKYDGWYYVNITHWEFQIPYQYSRKLIALPNFFGWGFSKPNYMIRVHSRPSQLCSSSFAWLCPGECCHHLFFRPCLNSGVNILLCQTTQWFFMIR